MAKVVNGITRIDNDIGIIVMPSQSTTGSLTSSSFRQAMLVGSIARKFADS
jgi:hypothetical protein